MAYKDRYGLSASAVNALKKVWYTKKVKDGAFESFDDFVRWSAENGYQAFAQLRRYDPDQPHGPDNSHWWVRPAYAAVPEHENTCAFCKGCTKGTCQNASGGCAAWKAWFIENWNKNIYRGPKTVLEKEG